ISASPVKRQPAGKRWTSSLGCDHWPGMRRAMVTGAAGSFISNILRPVRCRVFSARAPFLERLLQLRLQQRFHVALNGDLIADDHTAVPHLAIPIDLEIKAVDARLADKADPSNRSGVARGGPIGGAPLAQVMHPQHHGATDAANRQVAEYLMVGRSNA